MWHTQVFFLFLILYITCPVYTQVLQAFLHYLDSFGGCELWLPKLVTVKQGTMRGFTMFSAKRKPFCAFRRIPFSQPPTGQYRFKDPLPPQPWSGILDATKETPECMVVKSLRAQVTGQEDCLYLSVVTPQRKHADGRLMDVLIWIYPGEFYTGTNSMKRYGPHFFIDEDIVVVYLGFRSGALGFFSTGNDEAPGNYGLKDQVAGLNWVQENIKAFGGNPDSVTLIGFSSGGTSAHLHMMSPLSKGLFHRVISMEGTAIHPWARNPNPLQHAQKQAKLMNCPTEPTSELVACLRKVDAKNLTQSVFDLFTWWILPDSGYTPVVEQKTEKNPNPFLLEDPLKIMRTGKFAHLPLMIGGTSNGASLFGVLVDTLTVLRNQLKQDHETILKVILSLNVSVPADKIDNIYKIVKDFYGMKESLEPEVLIKMMSDRLLIHSVHKTVQLHALAGHSKIYKYNFAYRGLYSITDIFSLRNYGVSHLDEVFYLFHVGRLPLIYPHSSYDPELRDFMIFLWTNFIKYGNPTPGNATKGYLEKEVVWYPVGNVTLNNLHIRYLNIGQVITSPQNTEYLNEGRGPAKINMAKDLYKERMDFWDSLPLSENCLTDCY